LQKAVAAVLAGTDKCCVNSLARSRCETHDHMATYVDEAIWEWRGRRWCHLTADSPEELHELAAQLGLVRQWFQSKPDRPWNDHYDLPEQIRAQAIACGAQPLSTREMARRQAKLRERQRGGGMGRTGSDRPARARCAV
jgi:hypothetical protein